MDKSLIEIAGRDLRLILTVRVKAIAEPVCADAPTAALVGFTP
jgi:hypothetical protein